MNDDTTSNKVIYEASELGIGPGEWPKNVTADGDRWTFREFKRDMNGYIAAAVYDGTYSTRELHVLND